MKIWNLHNCGGFYWIISGEAIHKVKITEAMIHYKLSGDEICARYKTDFNGLIVDQKDLYFSESDAKMVLGKVSGRKVGDKISACNGKGLGMIKEILKGENHTAFLVEYSPGNEGVILEREIQSVFVGPPIVKHEWSDNNVSYEAWLLRQ